MAGNNIMNAGSVINRNMGFLQSTQAAQARRETEQPGSSFDRILQKQMHECSGLKFSKHAELRLESRNIHLTQVQKDKLGKAVNKAETKGVKDSLVIMENLAFVVNVKSKTVITALNSNELKDNVFTNIDGAVFA